MKLMSIKLLVLLPVLTLLISCGDSISEVSSGKLMVKYDNSVSIDQAKALLDWYIRDGRFGGLLALSHETNEFTIYMVGDTLPDKETSNTIQTTICGISSEVFEGSQVRILWTENQGHIGTIFELVKDSPPSRGWTCNSGASENNVAEPTTAPGQTAAPAKAAPGAKPQPTAVPTAAPIIFSDEQASAFLLKPDDFPKNWTAKKNGMFLDAQNDYFIDYNAQMIKITLQTHETESAAQTAFSGKKTEAQATIDGRGISGDKLENIKKYPLFVWNASPQANISGVEKWAVIGVYGNITVKVYNEGSMGAPKKGFAVDIAKKQIDRIKGD